MLLRNCFSLALIIYFVLSSRAAERPSVTHLRGHTATVEAVAFSPDGKTLASAGQDHTARLWDVATGKLKRTLEGERSFRVVAFCPDGKTLAFGVDDTSVRLWDIPADRERAILKAHGGPVRSIAFSQDGKTLAAIGQPRPLDDAPRRVRLWDVTTGQERFDLTDNESKPESAVFTADGKSLLVVHNHGEVKRWDLSTRKASVIWKTDFGGYRRIALSPDGKTLAIEDGAKIRLIDATTESERAPLTYDLPLVLGFAFSPDNKTLAGVIGGGRVRLWQIETGESRDVTPSEEGSPEKKDAFYNCIAFSSDGKTLAAGSDGGTIGVWAVSNAFSEPVRPAPKSAPPSTPPDAFDLGGRFPSVTVDSNRGVLVDGKPVNGSPTIATRPSREPSSPQRAVTADESSSPELRSFDRVKLIESPIAKSEEANVWWFIGGGGAIAIVAVIIKRRIEKSA